MDGNSFTRKSSRLIDKNSSSNRKRTSQPFRDLPDSTALSPKIRKSSNSSDDLDVERSDLPSSPNLGTIKPSLTMCLRSSSSSPKAVSTASISPENRKQTQEKPLKSISVTESDENISGGDAVKLTMKEHMKNSCSENIDTKKKKLTWRKRMRKKNLVSLKIHQNPNSCSDWMHTNKTLDVYHDLSFNDVFRPEDSGNYSLLLNDMESTIPSNSFKSGSSSINIPSISVPENFVVTKADDKLKQNSKSFDTSEEPNAISLLTHSTLNSPEVTNCDFLKNVDSASYVSMFNKSHMVVCNSEKCFISPDKNISIGQKSSSIGRHEAESHELPSSQQKSMDDVSLLSKGHIVDVLEVKNNAVTVLCDENQSAEYNNVSNLQADSSSHSVLPQVDNLIHVGKHFDTLSSDSDSWEDFKRRPNDRKQNIHFIDLFDEQQPQEKSPKIIRNLLPANQKLKNKNILSHIRGKKLNRFVRSNKNAEAPKQRRRSTKLRQTNDSSDLVIEKSVESNEGINSLTKSIENSDTVMDLTSDEGLDNNHFIITDLFNQASSNTKVKSKILIPCETKEVKSTTRHSTTTKGSIKEPKNYKTPAVRGRKSKNIKDRLNNCSSETLTDVECYNQGMPDDDKKPIEINDKMFHQGTNMVDKFLDSNTKSQKHTNSKVTCNKKLQKLTNLIDSSGAGKQKSHNIPTEVKKRNHYSSSSDNEELHSASASIAKTNCSGLARDDTKCQNIPTDMEKINHSSSSSDDEKLICSSASVVKNNINASAIVDTKCHDIPTEVEKINNSSSSDNGLHNSLPVNDRKKISTSASDDKKMCHKSTTRHTNSKVTCNKKLQKLTNSIDSSGTGKQKYHNIPTEVKKRNHYSPSSDNEKVHSASASIVKKNCSGLAIDDTKCQNIPTDMEKINHSSSSSDDEKLICSSASVVKNNINASAIVDTKCHDIPTEVEKINNSSSSDNGLHNLLPVNDRKKISTSASDDKKMCHKSTTRHTNSKVTCNKKLQKLTNSIDSSGTGKQKYHNIPTEVKKRNHYSSSSDNEKLHSASASIVKKNCSGLAIDDTKCQNIPTDLEKINHSSSSSDDEKLNYSSASVVKNNINASAIVDTKCHDIPTEVEKINNSSSSDNGLHNSLPVNDRKKNSISASDDKKICHKSTTRHTNSKVTCNKKLQKLTNSMDSSGTGKQKYHNIPTEVKKRNHYSSSSDNEKLHSASASIVKQNCSELAIDVTKCQNIPTDMEKINHSSSSSNDEKLNCSSGSVVKNNINASAIVDTKCHDIPTEVEKRNNSSSSDNGLHNSLPVNDRKNTSTSASDDKKICHKSTTRGMEKIVKTSVTGGRKKPVRNNGSQNPRTGRDMKSHYSKGIDKYSIPKISKSRPTRKDSEKQTLTFLPEDTSKSAPLSHTNKQNNSPEKKEHTFVKMTVPSFSNDEVSVVDNNNWTNKRIPLLSNINETVLSSEKKMGLKEGEHEATTNSVKPLNSSKSSPFENFPDKSFDNSIILKQSTKSSDINIEKSKAIPLVNKDLRNMKRDTKHSSKRSHLLPTYVSDSHFEKPGSLEGTFEEMYSKRKNENKDSSLHNKIGTSRDMVPNKIASPNPLKTVYNFEWYKKRYCNIYTQESGPKKPSPQETSGIKESYEEKSTHITEFTQSLCPPQFQNGKNVNSITDDKYINSNSEKTNELNYQDCSVQENMDKNLKLFEMITSNTTDKLGLSKKDENMIKPVDRSFRNQNSYLFISSAWKEKEKVSDGCGSDFAFPKYQSGKLDSVNNRNLTSNSPDLTTDWEENEEIMFSGEDHSDLSSRKESFAYSNSNHDKVNNGEGFHHDASKTLVKGAMEEADKLQNSTDSTSIKNCLDHSKVEDNFQHDSSGERPLSNTSAGQNKVFLRHKELSDANDKDTISSASFIDLQSFENNKKHPQKPTDSKQVYDDNLFSEELFKKYFRPNYCIRKILNNYCPHMTSCRKKYHSIREDFFYAIKKEEIGILVRTVFKKSKRITPSFLSALLNFFGRHAAVTPILSLSKRFLCKEFLNNTRKPNQSYFIKVSASFFSALKACGFLRPRDMLEELVKYNSKFFSVCDLEKILFILEHWNIASPFLSPVWPILKPLANIKGVLLSAKILSKLFDEAISSSDCDLLTFVANQLLLLPVERLDIFKKKELKNFILKMINAGLSTEAKSLSKLIPDYYSVEDISRNKPLKTKARPLSDVSSKIVHISQECSTRRPTEFDRKGTQYGPWLDQKESSNTNMNNLLQEAQVAIKCAVESENYYRLSLTVIKYSEQGIGKAVLSYVFNFFNEKEPLVMTESLITELSKVAEYKKYKLFCGSLLSSFVVYFAEEGMWEVSRGFLLSFEKFCIDKYRVKNIYDDLSPIRLIFIYSEVFFQNNCYKASVEEIIQNDVLKNVKKNVCNDDEVFAQQIIESYLQEYIKLKETSIGVQLFSYILDSNFKRIDLTEYFEEIINQVFQNSPLDETPLNLYISLSQKADVKLFGLAIRALLIIAYRLKKWSTVEDLFKRGLDEGCYPCPEAKEYSIKLLKSFSKEEIFCYISEWCLNFKKRLHQGSRTTHLNLSADKNSILKMNRLISVSFKEEGLADYISTSSCGTPVLLKDIDESFEGSMARLVSALKSFNFNILGVINKTLIIDFESVINLLKQT